MTGKKISELQALTELTGTEIIPVAKDGQNYGVETLALLGISVYDIPEPLDDNYIYTPGIETASLYEVIDREHDGTLSDPIPYTPPMEIFEGKYYIQSSVLYRCTRDSGTALTHNLSELVRLYVEVVEES